MANWVEKLEELRASDPAGPSGALGTMVKAVGNNAYGKTLEQHEGIELVMAESCPDGYKPYRIEDNAYDSVFFRFTDDERERDYHRPQIGAFVTAHVRMVVRRAALVNPDEFVYADTDCVAFTVPAHELDIHQIRYGAWKQETNGEPHIVLGKKAYATADGTTIRCKGLNVKRLTIEDMELWRDGQPPAQEQVQRVSFMKVMAGRAMFRDQVRHGTDFHSLKTVTLADGYFAPRLKRRE
jgi:hypothetical protein